MYKGISTVQVACHSVVEVTGTSEFSVIIGERIINSHRKYLKFKMPDDEDTFELEPEQKTGRCSVTFRGAPPKNIPIDPTPMAIPTGHRRPRTTEEIIARVLKINANKQEASQEIDLSEEDNDYEIYDEPDFGRGSELREMAPDRPDIKTNPIPQETENKAQEAPQEASEVEEGGKE